LSYLHLENKDGIEKKKNTTGWYRSPLASTSISFTGAKVGFPIVGGVIPGRPSDLVLSNAGEIDATYSAAFEIGRLTALDDVDFATGFYKWKNEVTTDSRLSALKANPNYPNISHLPVSDNAASLVMPQHLQDKIEAWKNLENIPYEYIVPEPSVLPTESIRFFQIDPQWINSFLCGAFSIGHTASALSPSTLESFFMNKSNVRTGFIINSMVVSGWPDFLVNAYPASADIPLKLKRKDTLDTDMRIYIVEGQFNELEFFLHPMKTHSGFHYNSPNFTKYIGGENKPVTMKPHNVVNIGDLVTLLNVKSVPNFPVANFAGAMLEGTPQVVFKIGNLPAT
jgi:hypothetical protein